MYPIIGIRGNSKCSVGVAYVYDDWVLGSIGII